jgi:chemosensory pili system protein ChpA (sensor histidine kinase/response regulator)
MSNPDIDPSLEPDALAEAQLQQELRTLFAVDTQNYLQRYSQIVEQLCSHTWASDIQELYRCIHTVKGGAVTVGAEAVLQVAIVVEDVLSDLRYLDLAPPLDDGHLRQVLLEIGELLTGTLDISGESEAIAPQIQPLLNRIQILHNQVRERYLPTWNEQRQLHQDFAEQGFDLVVLDWEILMERSPTQGSVFESTLNIAQQTLAQLRQIGRDLQFASGWTALIKQAEALFEHPDNSIWQSQVPRLFQALKTCAKEGGNAVPFEFDFTPSAAPANPQWGTNGHLQPASASEPTNQVANHQNQSNTPLDFSQPANQFSEADSPAHNIQEISAFLDDLHPVEESTHDQSMVDDDSDMLVPIDDDLDLTDLTDTRLADVGNFLDQVIETEPSERNNTDSNWMDSLDDLFPARSAAANAEPAPARQEAADTSDAASVSNVDSSLDSESPSPSLDTSSPDVEHAEQSAHTESALDAISEADDDQAETDEDDSASWDVGEATDVLSLFDFPQLNQTENAENADPSSDEADDLALDQMQLDFTDLTEVDSTTAATGESQLSDATNDRSLLPSAGSQESAANRFTPVAPAIPRPLSSPLSLERLSSITERVQIPVPLEKLDQSAQYLVETLLTARMMRGFYQTLQTQLTQLVTLAQEGAQHITHLRQIQDDYALLDNLRSDAQGPTPERYRQGYTTINRLLETSLRLSELGTEAERSAQQTAETLLNLDGNLLKLQNTIEDSRLVPFQNLGFRARAILRDLTTRYGKPAQLIIQGEQIELDVSTARGLEPALLHLIRNAYDHGLEPVDQRVARGKPEAGTLVLSLQRRGNTFQMQLRDDGRGIDTEAVRNRAESLGLPLTRTQTAAELLAVICQPGFSSETRVSEVSGRGVGMDIIAAQISRLGGKLSLDTTPGAGTTFHLQFPVPHLLVSCLMLQAGDRTFAIPTDDIRTTALFDTLTATRVEEPTSAYSRMIHGNDGATPALDLLEYWRSRSRFRSLPDTAVCVYIHPQDAEKGVWLIADELLGQSDLLINPIPEPLISPQGLMGVSLQSDGSLVPVLETASLTEQLLEGPVQAIAAVGEPAEPLAQETDAATQTILIVDDAALIRRRIEASLSAYGYTTHTCGDGMEAWNWLQKHPHVPLIITDIEMPMMDGFTLIDRCRQAGITAPVLVISSRLSEEWFAEARRLGATDYLTKGFSTLELVSKVKALMGTAVAH